MSGSTLRKHLTAKQERSMTQDFVKIREEYDVRNNSDAVVVWAQQQIAAGKEAELVDELVTAAKTVSVPKRSVPWDDTTGH